MWPFFVRSFLILALVCCLFLFAGASGRDPEYEWAARRVRDVMEPQLGSQFFDSISGRKYHWVDFNDVFTTLRVSFMSMQHMLALVSQRE